MSSTTPPIPDEVQAAIDAFAAADVGQQLANVEECDGRCFTASAKFRSALREFGSTGLVLEFNFPDSDNAGKWWFHQVTVVAESTADLHADTIVVDWTVRQFKSEQNAPYPRIERLEDAVKRWGLARHIDGVSYGVLRDRSENPEAGPWSEAQKRIPDRTTKGPGSAEADHGPQAHEG